MHAPRDISMKHLQGADRLLGAFAAVVLQPLRAWRKLFPGRPARRVLLIKFWGMGSLQLLTPAVHAVRTRYPGARLTLLTLHRNREFARGLEVFDDVLTFRVASASWFRIGWRILALIGRLRRERFDVVYDFEFFTRFSAVVSMLSGARRTFGFSSPSVWRGGLHTRTVLFNRYWHVARNFRCLVGGENGEDVVAEDITAFRVRDEHRSELDLRLVELGLDDSGPLAVVNPNAGTLSLERRWPQSSFAELARRLIRERGARVALIGAPGEMEWTNEVEVLIGGPFRGRLANLAGKLSIGALHALLERADAFVGNDSGPMHLAAARGIPTLGLFGPETPIMYRPIGSHAGYLYKPPPCSPCINVHNNKFAVCALSRAECLIGISPDEVFHQATRLLGGREPLRVLEPRAHSEERAEPVGKDEAHA